MESGVIKFKETSSGTPFYIEQFKDRAELTINEQSFAPSNYSEQIQKCFNVSGNMTGYYRNVKAALCEYDDISETWHLIQKGDLSSIR